MSINGDWMKTTPAVKRTTFNAILAAGELQMEPAAAFSSPAGFWNWKPDICEICIINYNRTNSRW